MEKSERIINEQFNQCMHWYVVIELTKLQLVPANHIVLL
jgi:hypothetical protein